DLQGVVGVQPDLVQHDVDQRVDLADAVPGRFGLGFADVGDAVDNLALQVGLVDHVEVDDAERAAPGRGQVQQGGRAEAAGSNDQDLGVLQPLLPGHADVRDDQVTGVTPDLVDGQRFGGLHQ